MICPNCGSNMSDKRLRCERCGTDLTLYKKIYRASNQYYNNGLARAKVRDLSGAIIALHNSLELDKTNTNARNLLGLIYFEMGETVAALSEWVISRHFKPKDNDADDYINRVQSNPTKLDTLNQAIKRYNNALNFAKQGSDDLAIIQLKKVISLNPRFIRAFHLLALLYMKNSDNERAKKCLFKAAKIDVSNTTTLRYMRQLEDAAQVKDSESNPEAEESGLAKSIMPISTYKEDKPNIMVFVNLIIGIIIGVAVTSILVIPSIKKNITSNQNNNYVNYSSGVAEQQEKENTIKSLKKDKEDLQKQVDDLKGQAANITPSEDKTAIYDSLYSIIDTYITESAKPKSSRDYTDIGDKMTAIDETTLDSDAAKKLYDRIKTDIYPEMTKQYYETGHNHYLSGKYDDALKELLKALDFDPKNVDAVYFIGRTYDRQKDKDNAKKYYNMVINDFSDSNRVASAKSYLKLLK